MELNSDLIAIQGLLRTAEKSTGEFTRIKHKGGNEDKITLITTGLKTFMQENGYTDSTKQPRDIVMFLVLNTEFKNNTLSDIKEYSHLINVIPKFSNCLLFNVIVELDVIDAYGEVLQLLPLSLSHEMLNESIKCLSKRSPDVMLRNIYSITKAVIRKLSAVDLSTFKVRESVTELNDITSTLLLILSRFDVESVSGWNKKKIYQHIGHCLLKLFDLMLACDSDNEVHTTILDQLIMTTCCIMKVVTLNVFCEWAEVTSNNESLQASVSTSGYRVMEKYTKYNKARELIGMLGPMARKPKSLQQQITESTPETMIAKIEENGPEQRHWFTALLNTKVLHSGDAVNCVEKWHRLCTIEDVNRLLLLGTEFKNDVRVKRLIGKCAGNLDLEELTLTISRYFWQHGINSELQYENVGEQLVMWINKKGDLNEMDASTNKRLQLLLFQNPGEFLSTAYEKCLEDGVSTAWLRPIFVSLQNVLIKEKLCLNVLKKTVGFNGDFDIRNCTLLIKMLSEAKCLDSSDLYYWLREALGTSMKDENEAGLKQGLNLLLELNINEFGGMHKTDLALFSLDVLAKYRCSYLKFSTRQLEISISAIKILQTLRVTVENATAIPKLNQHYVKIPTCSFLDTLFTDFSMDNYGDAVSKLIQVLSRCVPDEWALLSADLQNKYTSEKTVEALTDTILLISQVTNTQQESENHTAFAALKYYLGCYSVCLKNMQNNGSDISLEMCIVRNVVRMLKEIPEPLSFNEGILFVTIFTPRALKQLKDDKNFVCSLVDMHAELSKLIALKMLE